jgi:hypothetical protein
MRTRAIYLLTLTGAAMSFLHHVDHAVRGNAIGWPLTDEVNAFTISLGIYPIIATGLLLYRAGRMGPGFWALVSDGGAAFVSAVHFGPLAVEPPHLIRGGYEQPVIGWLALGWVVAFAALLAVTCVYETRLWFSRRQAGRPGAGGAPEGATR